MNTDILKELYYDPKFGYLSFDKFKDKVQDLYPDITAKEIKEFIKNQEIEQITKNQYKTTDQFLKINAPDLSFQIDLVFLPKALKTGQKKKLKDKKEGVKSDNNLYVFLLCVDILSRKAFIYSLPNKNKETIMKFYKQFLLELLNEVEKMIGTVNQFDRLMPYEIITDSQFNFKEFLDLNNKLDIKVDAQTI
jgi:hypothetical protein